MDSAVLLKVEYLENYSDLPKPCYQTAGSAGFDVYAAIDKDVVISPGEVKLIPTGMKFQLQSGYEAQVRPRSGLALKHGMTLLNSPGTIDSDYRGEVGIIMVNHSRVDYTVKRGQRIAQIVIAKYYLADFVEVSTVDDTSRGQGGFGHTGI